MPNSCIAIASRSVSFSILPSASTASQYTVSLSRNDPLASTTDTPSCSYASAYDADPSAADFMDLMFFAIDFVSVSVETSTNSAAYIYSCNLSVAMPVWADMVKTLSAYSAPPTVIFTSAFAAATAAAVAAAKAAAATTPAAFAALPNPETLLSASFAASPASSMLPAPLFPASSNAFSVSSACPSNLPR